MSDYDVSIHSNPDARAWARFFCETFGELERPDEETMAGWFANAMMAALDHAERQRALPPAPDEGRHLRRLLWVRHDPDHLAALYGDDGEMQCNACLIDFKRNTPQEIEDCLSSPAPRPAPEEPGCGVCGTGQRCPDHGGPAEPAKALHHDTCAANDDGPCDLGCSDPERLRHNLTLAARPAETEPRPRCETCGDSGERRFRTWMGTDVGWVEHPPDPCPDCSGRAPGTTHGEGGR